MIFSIEIDPGVYRELEDYILYYESKQRGLGVKFFADWEGSLEYLAKISSFLTKKYSRITDNYHLIDFLI